MVKNKKGIKMAFIATYPKMAKLFTKVTEEMGIEAYTIYAKFQDAADIAKQAEPNIDAILSRGGTGRYIMDAVDIPVINIPMTPFDVTKIISNLNEDITEVAIIHYNEEIPEMEFLEKIYNLSIRQYTFRHYEDIKNAVEDAVSRGINHIIGGQVAVEYAQTKGCVGYEVSSGEAAIRNAINEAINILNETEKEKENSARIQSIFESITDGVIATDDKAALVVVNEMAEKLLGKKQRTELEWEFFLQKEFQAKFKTVLETGNEIINELRTYNNNILMCNFRPIYFEEKIIGCIGVFSDVTLIQKAEKKIRKELAATGLTNKYTFDSIVTVNKSMNDLKDIAAKYAKTDSAIFIEGESGTGKELFAQGIHAASQRRNEPFVAINCAAIGENLIESELFGYEEGAFTGAVKGGKAGLFEVAHGGTLFLDEIGEISMSVQTSLLRVLQEKEVRRIGGKGNIPVDVRIVSATNRDLKSLVEEGKFRNDLYYRLNVLSIKVPPLRNRKDDLDELCPHLLGEKVIEIPKPVLKRCISLFKEYSWPGNIRELQNVMERLEAMHPYIEKSEDDEYIKKMLGIDYNVAAADISMSLNLDGSLKDIIHRTEKQVIDYFMESFSNNQDMVAERLDIGKTTLWRKSKEETDFKK